MDQSEKKRKAITRKLLREQHKKNRDRQRANQKLSQENNSITWEKIRKIQAKMFPHIELDPNNNPYKV